MLHIIKTRFSSSDSLISIPTCFVFHSRFLFHDKLSLSVARKLIAPEAFTAEVRNNVFKFNEVVTQVLLLLSLKDIKEYLLSPWLYLYFLVCSLP